MVGQLLDPRRVESFSRLEAPDDLLGVAVEEALADDAPVKEPAKAPAKDDAKDASHLAAVQELFKVMHMDETMTKSIDAMLDQQVKQNPLIGRFRAVMSAFLQKHMSWQSIEPDMAKIYMQEFTEQEIKEMTAFYKTPLGQKFIAKSPAMMAKAAEIGQARVQANMAELQKMIADEEAKQKQ